ncbi:unnamed protein product [Gordionus sp. m RMFG-2023]
MHLKTSTIISGYYNERPKRLLVNSTNPKSLTRLTTPFMKTTIIPGKTIVNSFTIAIFIPFFGPLPFTLERSYAMLLLGLKKANEILKPHALDWIIMDTGSDDLGETMYEKCTEEFTAFQASKVYYTYNVTAFLGPVCYSEFYAIAFLASRWRIPLITPFGPNFNNPDVWPTTMRTGVSVLGIVSVYIAVLNYFNWTDYFMIYDLAEYPLFPNFGEQIIMFGTKKPVAYITLNSNSMNPNYLVQLIAGSMLSRVFFLESMFTSKRDLLLNAYDMGLLEEGEYVFLTTELWKCKCFGGSFFDLEHDPRIEDLKKAYESVLLITFKRSETSEIFHKKVKNLTAKLHDFNYYFGNEDISPMIQGFYNGLVVYATTVKQQLIEKGDTHDGRIMAAKMSDRSIKTESGEFVINRIGDQNFDYIIWDFDAIIQNWRPILTYNEKDGIKFINGSFKVHWPHRVDVPLNQPICGFRGDDPKCIPKGRFNIIGLGIESY